jgi:hypothetical protein
VVEKRSKAGVTLRCIKEGCDYSRDAAPEMTNAKETMTNDQ